MCSPGGGGNLTKMRGCAIQIVKVPPINPEKFLKGIPINLDNFLKIMPINPEMPKQLTNKWILRENYAHKSGIYHEKGTQNMAQPRSTDKLSYPPRMFSWLLSQIDFTCTARHIEINSCIVQAPSKNAPHSLLWRSLNNTANYFNMACCASKVDLGKQTSEHSKSRREIINTDDLQR